MDLFAVNKYFMQDSFQNVVKCWWRSKEINCNGLFVNQFLDVGACFTFQPNKEAAWNIETSGKKAPFASYVDQFIYL